MSEPRDELWALEQGVASELCGGFPQPLSPRGARENFVRFLSEIADGGGDAWDVVPPTYPGVLAAIATAGFDDAQRRRLFASGPPRAHHVDGHA